MAAVSMILKNFFHFLIPASLHAFCPYPGIFSYLLIAFVFGSMSCMLPAPAAASFTPAARIPSFQFARSPSLSFPHTSHIVLSRSAGPPFFIRKKQSCADTELLIVQWQGYSG
jgi:hypothetical protein